MAYTEQPLSCLPPTLLGAWGLKEPICLKALCEQSTLYFTFLFTLFIFGQSREDLRITL